MHYDNDYIETVNLIYLSCIIYYLYNSQNVIITIININLTIIIVIVVDLARHAPPSLSPRGGEGDQTGKWSPQEHRDHPLKIGDLYK